MCSSLLSSKQIEKIQTDVLKLFSDTRSASKSGFIKYIGGNEYFPIFSEVVQYGMYGENVGDPKEDNSSQQTRILEKDKVVDGHQADIIEYTTVNDVEGAPQMSRPQRSVWAQRVEGDQILIKREGMEGWMLDFVFPADGAIFMMHGQNQYQWKYIGDWTSPVTGKTYNKVYRLQSSGGQYMIFAPRLGEIYTESPGAYRYSSE